MFRLTISTDGAPSEHQEEKALAALGEKVSLTPKSLRQRHLKWLCWSYDKITAETIKKGFMLMGGEGSDPKAPPTDKPVVIDVDADDEEEQDTGIDEDLAEAINAFMEQDDPDVSEDECSTDSYDA